MPKPARRAASCAALSFRAQREGLARHGKPAPKRTQDRAVAVEADDVVLGEIVETSGQAAARDVTAMGIERDAHLAEALGDKRLLHRTDHAHGDVGVAPRKVLVAVAERKLERDRGVTLAELGQDRGQHLGADEVAGGDAHRARRLLRLA